VGTLAERIQGYLNYAKNTGVSSLQSDVVLLGECLDALTAPARGEIDLSEAPGVFVPLELYSELTEDSNLLKSLLNSGRLWWARYNPHREGYSIVRVPIASREDAEAELHVARVEERT
jgi:hypothetical protein